jgi:predicted nucleic acid-binding protein
MSRIVLLDAGPLGMASHPLRNPATEAWLFRLLRSRAVIAIPEIADYEVRRELIRANRIAGIARLDELKQEFRYLPITTDIMLRAAEYWAKVRRQGIPTAPDLVLDADVILAATSAEQVARGDDVVIATTNPRHLSRLAPAQLWHEITP